MKKTPVVLINGTLLEKKVPQGFFGELRVLCGTLFDQEKFYYKVLHATFKGFI